MLVGRVRSVLGAGGWGEGCVGCWWVEWGEGVGAGAGGWGEGLVLVGGARGWCWWVGWDEGVGAGGWSGMRGWCWWVG